MAIVSELAAERFWPGETPLGKRLQLTLMSDDSYEVVGVVGEIKTDQLDEQRAETAVYLPWAQVGFGGAAVAGRPGRASSLAGPWWAPYAPSIPSSRSSTS